MGKAKKSKTGTPKKSKSGTLKDICFVIMPFGGWLDDYYQDIYCPAINAAGLEPHRADDLFSPSSIVNDIWTYTKKARLILADLSGKNPNVFYELGLAHALAKPAILVAESMEDVPFDLRPLRVLVYDKNAPNWGKVLQVKVQAAIGEVIKSPAERVLPMFLETKGATHKPNVTPQEKEVLELRQQLDILREEIRSSVEMRPRSLRPTSSMRDRLEEARAMLREYIARGAPDKVIVRELKLLGAPLEWIHEEIFKLRRGGVNLLSKKA
ncbi:MAG: hypothetical protein OEY86_15140 [Nitrospira sp.]|nr:hypothetical protein [Nitrospira sp.]